jgi:dolichol-phosphate mannosyltransferase
MAKTEMDGVNALATDDWVAWAQAGVPDLLSIVIPAHNEEASIATTLASLQRELDANKVPYEIIVVNDNSVDRTRDIVLEIAASSAGRVRLIDNHAPNGFGRAVRRGLRSFSGDAVVITMADGSDAPSDIVKFYKELQAGYDCVFGSRFIAGAIVSGYPPIKLAMNRFANFVIRLLTLSSYNDFTNGFKCYRRYVIGAIQPLVSTDFNLTIEMSLKAIFRRYSFAVVPNSWADRNAGKSSFRMGTLLPRYAFTLIYCWFERILLGADPSRTKTLLLEAHQPKKPE